MTEIGRGRLGTYLRPTFSGVGFLALLLVVLLVQLLVLLVARGPVPVVLLLVVEAIVFSLRLSACECGHDAEGGEVFRVVMRDCCDV